MLNSVLRNLLNNSIKFSKNESKIEISFKNVNGFVEIAIKDEGIGIKKQDLNELFKLASNNMRPGTHGEKGTGLSLALAKLIVEKHNGDIWFYSGEGRGSEFHFTMPASVNSILIVKENPEERRYIEENIKKCFIDFKITSAENSFEALGIVSSRMPSLIIVDHDMPLMDGIQFAKTVRKENKIRFQTVHCFYLFKCLINGLIN